MDALGIINFWIHPQKKTHQETGERSVQCFLVKIQDGPWFSDVFFVWLFLVKIGSFLVSFLDYLHIMEIYGYPPMRPKPQNSWVIKSLTIIVP